MPFNREIDFENALIDQLGQRGWEQQILNQPSEEELIRNWAEIIYHNNNMIDRLNNAPLTDGEMRQILAKIEELRTPIALNEFINHGYVSIRRDNPNDQLHYTTDVTLKIFDPQEIAAGQSRYQIARQPHFRRANPLAQDRRGDLMLLFNGMPLIHIELKKSGIPVSQAYHQIEKYSREHLFTGIYRLIQIFVAMTPEETVYFANPGIDGQFNTDFFFHWADFNNMPRNDWNDIATYLLSIPMAHQLIGYYTIADKSDGILKVLRSYQYEAVRAIYDKVVKHRDWTIEDGHLGGYIWHTTGSGKTMSSFKSAQLIAATNQADKVVFVIDRIELGTQSAENYRYFANEMEEINETEDTATLRTLLAEDNDATLIITSIQKLALIANSELDRQNVQRRMPRRMVFIVDECHRSVAGDSFAEIKATFPRAMFFGFTGTPIQEENQQRGNTTSDIFGNELHRYSIADGIRDKNVLGFDLYQVSTYRDKDLRRVVALEKAGVNSEEELWQNEERRSVFDAWMARPMAGALQPDGSYLRGIEDELPNAQYEREEHCQAVVTDILEDLKIRSRGGKFHALFATSSIPQAIRYYRIFKERAPELKVTALFDPSLLNDDPDQVLDREYGLVEILQDYNERYGLNFDLAGHAQFKKDLSLRLAHKESYRNLQPEEQIDLLIVVSQMLTGFDSKWINTLYLDKVLQYANLIQAFSRTNRLFGLEKPFGVIKYYQRPHTMQRNIEEAVRLYAGEQELALFVDKLGQNIEGMNQMFDEISQLFANERIENFSRLPQENDRKARFAQLFRQYNHYLEAARLQGFRWDTATYIVDGCRYTLHHNEHSYNALLQRYKELFTSRGEEAHHDGDLPYEVDPYLVEINTAQIDTNYMNQNFRRYVRALHREDITEQELDNLLRELTTSFAYLSQEEQRFAEVLIRDIRNNNIVLEPDKSCRDYITDYMQQNQEAAVNELVENLGIDRAILQQIIDRHPTQRDLNQFGQFDRLTESVDLGRARDYFLRMRGEDLIGFPLRMEIGDYIEDFILNRNPRA